jgi:MFS family permease
VNAERGEKQAPRAVQFLRALSRPMIFLLLLQLMGGMMLMPHRAFFPIYVQDLGYGAAQISMLSAMGMALALLASLVGGTLSDRIGRKWTLLLGNVGFGLAGLLYLTPRLGWIGLLWGVGSFCMGLHTLGSQSYLVDAAPAAYLGLSAALYNWGYTLGGALSSPALGYLLDRWNYGAFGSAVTTFAMLAVAINVLYLPRLRAPVDLDGAAHGAASPRALFGYATLARRPIVVLLVAMRFLPTLAYGVATVFLPLLLADAGASKTVVAAYVTVSQAVASLAQVVVGRAADRWGGRWPTVLVYAALIASTLGTGLLARSLWGVFAFGTAAAAAAWSLSTLLPGWVAHVTMAAERGRVLGWIHLWWNVAMMLGSMLGGALYDRLPGFAFLLTGALNVFSVPLAFVFYRAAKGPVPGDLRSLEGTGP